MADIKEDEYHLGDITANAENPDASKAESSDLAGQAVTFIQRNALMGVGVLLALVFVYKFIGLFFSHPSETKPKLDTFATTQSQPKPKPLPVQAPPTQPAEVTLKPEVSQKLMALESSQQGVRGDIADMNAQLNGLQSTIQDLSSQLSNINNTLQSLNQKLDAQMQSMQLLEARLVAKPQVSRPVHHHVKKMRSEATLYYIQAVIPGRAWLISANGRHTLTVREGTRLPGYGVVQLIDPNQGRVLTSSGQTIKFSQQDS